MSDAVSGDNPHDSSPGRGQAPRPGSTLEVYVSVLQRLSVAMLCAAVLPFAVPARAGAQSAAGCTGAAAVPSAGSETATGHAVICLVNAERAARGLPALREVALLDLAAGRFAAQMVALRFFDHVAPDGSGLEDRVAATGYAAAGVGEDIGEGEGADASSPAAMVAMWMDSAPHRANILDPGFRDAGAGVVLGDAGLGGVGDAVTYVLDLAAPAGARVAPAVTRARAAGASVARRCRAARYRRAHRRLCRLRRAAS
jgi:uncharacterized protein YkwD